MRKILTILIAILIGCNVSCYAQGKVTRQKKEKTVTQKPTPKKTANKKKGQENKKEESKGESAPAPSNYINGHEYVDLGLPSGTKWATCNIGASSPEEYGDYFAQGETKPKSSYTRENSQTFFKSFHDLQKEGIIDPTGILKRKYDAASVNWGGTWRMPTKAECDEILEKCKWKIAVRHGNRGYLVIGPNGKSIYLPLTGKMYGSDVSRVKREGHYGSSSAYNDGDFVLFYNISLADNDHRKVRSRSVLGHSVRPVSD